MAEGSQLGSEERILKKIEKVKLYASKIQQVPTDEGGGLRERAWVEVAQQLERQRDEAGQIGKAKERAEVINCTHIMS